MVPFDSFGTVSYSHSIATVAASLAVSTQYTNVTDRQTQHGGIGRAYAQHCAATYSNNSPNSVLILPLMGYRFAS